MALHARTSNASSSTWTSCTRCSRRASQQTPAPALVFQEADLSVRVVRDIFSEHFERAIVDDERQYERLTSFLTRTAPGARPARRALGARPGPLRDLQGRRGDRAALSRRVNLPSGGYLMIDHAEALTVIDVNSGSFTGRGKDGRAGGDDHADQSRGRRRGRQSAAVARYRRDHRDRLHRHGARA